MLSPNTEYIIYKQRERELEAKIELINKTRIAAAYGQTYQVPSLFTRITQWLGEKISRLALQKDACPEEAQLCADCA